MVHRNVNMEKLKVDAQNGSALQTVNKSPLGLNYRSH